jgi:hypothetical protein
MVSIISLLTAVLVLQHAPPTGAKFDREWRAVAWCRRPPNETLVAAGIDEYLSADMATRHYCDQSRHMAYYNEFARKCCGQMGIADRRIYWPAFRKCCIGRGDAGQALNEADQLVEEFEERMEAERRAKAKAEMVA